jgi:hypothetical protein
MTRAQPPPTVSDELSAASEQAADWVRLLFQRANPKAALHAAQTLAQSAERTLQLACVLAQSGRAVDLSGLEEQIGRLTAAAIDLEDEDRRQMQPILGMLLHRLASLEHALHPPPSRLV